MLNSLEKSSYKEADMTDSRLKFEETGTTLQKSLLPIEMDKSQEIRLEDFEFQKFLEWKFGAKLLSFLQNQFQNYIVKESYKCNEEDWGYAKVKNMEKPESFPTSFNEGSSKNSFSHSYRYNTIQSLNDKILARQSAQNYLDSAIKTRISLKDLQEYHLGGQTCENLVNAYLRLLEVYSELKGLQSQFEDPSHIPVGIKIFETNYLDEFIEESQTGVISNAIDEEFQDFLEQQFLIIPANVSQSLNFL